MFSDRKLSMSGGGSVGVDSTHAAFLAKVGGKISMTTKDGSLHSLTPSTPPTASRQHHLSAASSTAPAASYAFPGKQHFKSQKHAILQRRYKRKRNKVTFPGSTAATTNDDTKQLVVKSAPSLDQLGLEGMEESDGEDGMEDDGGNSERRLQTALPPLRAIAGAPYSDILALDEGMQLPITASAGEMKCELPITVLKKEATTGPSSIPVLKAIHMPQMEPNIRQSQLLPHMMENSETRKASLTELEQLCLSKFTEKDLTATVVKEVAEEVRKRWIRVESVNPKEGQDELEGLPLSFSMNPCDYDVEFTQVNIADQALPQDTPSTDPLLASTQPQRHIVGSNVWKGGTKLNIKPALSPTTSPRLPRSSTSSTQPSPVPKLSINLATTSTYLMQQHILHPRYHNYQQQRHQHLQQSLRPPSPQQLLVPLQHYPYMRNLPPSIPTGKGSQQRQYLAPSGVAGTSTRPSKSPDKKKGDEGIPSTPTSQTPNIFPDIHSSTPNFTQNQQSSPSTPVHRPLTSTNKIASPIYTFPPMDETSHKTSNHPTHHHHRTSTTPRHSAFFNRGGGNPVAVPPPAPKHSLTTAATLYHTKNSRRREGMNTSLSLYSTLYGGTPSVTSPSPPPFPVSDDHRQNPHHLPRIDPVQTFLSIEPPQGVSEGEWKKLGKHKGQSSEMYWKWGDGVEERKRATVVTGQMKGDEEKVFTVGGMAGFDVKLGSLGPDLTGDEYQTKLEKLQRQRRYAEQIRHRAIIQRSKRLSRTSSHTARTAKLLSRSPQKGLEEASKKRAKMLQYASTIKKPVLKLPPLDPYPPPPTARHEKYSRYETEDGDDDDDVGERTINELEALQEEHARNLKVVEGIKRELRMV